MSFTNVTYFPEHKTTSGNKSITQDKLIKGRIQLLVNLRMKHKMFASWNIDNIYKQVHFKSED